MKSKALTYVLLAVVLGIWYQVFVRIKSNVDADAENPVLSTNLNSGFQLIKKDTFLLNATYRDPFIGRNKTELSLIPEQISAPKPQVVKPQFVWPTINYYGLVRKTDSKNPLCIVNIDGVLLYLRKGDEVFDNIKVVQIDRDLIQLKKGKHQKYFYRE